MPTTPWNKRTPSWKSGAAFAVTLSAFALLAATTTGCEVGVGPDYPGAYYGDGYGYGYPSDAWLATTEPYYYEGHAAYWYGGRWNYREGGRWNHYGAEPRGLYQQRMRGPQSRYMYESHGRSGGRGGGGGGGGARGGGGGGHR
jgi:hypothetical protein